MDNNSAVALAAIGLVGLMLTAVVKPLFKLLKENTQALTALVASNEKIAKATSQGANEAKQRNGHLAELVISTAKGTQTLMDKPISVQTVETQVVKDQK